MLWGLILDVLTVGLLAVFVIVSAKKGFAKTILKLAAVVAGFCFAQASSPVEALRSYAG